MTKSKVDKPPEFVRTISSVVRTKMTVQNKIFSFMTGESKKIYNTTIFHTNIFSRYQNDIFKELLELVNSGKVIDIEGFDDTLYEIYDKYYKKYLDIKGLLESNNNIIYKHIKEYLDDNDVYLVNDNYKKVFDIVVKRLIDLKLLTIPDPKYNDELFIIPVKNILASIYSKNFDKFRDCITNHIPCPHDDLVFIEQVKNDEYMSLNYEPAKNYKQILKAHPFFVREKDDKETTIKSNQNYIARIVYKYYTDCKIPSDLMCNIIAKVHQNFNSYFALLQKKIRAKKPTYLDKDAKFILPYYPRSRKLVNVNGIEYYRLTVGQHVADNFPDIVGDVSYKCLNDGMHKKYAKLSHMFYSTDIKKIAKRKNFIINIGNNEGYYIDKKSNKIVDAYYVFIQKPPKSELDKLVLIEVNPIHNGQRHKVNFMYKIESDTNKPDEGKQVSIDLGIINLMTIYDPHGEQKIIKGACITKINQYYNHLIDNCKSGIAHQDPDLTQDLLKNILSRRHNIIDNYMNNLVNWFVTTYKDCATIIIGYNVGWKQKVNMGKKMNRKFYDIPYAKLIHKLKNKLEASNQRLEIINESYTSKCDALALEDVCRHDKYNGKRGSRGLFSSHPKEIYSSVQGKMIKPNKKGVLLNADLNGAINIMRKWEEKNGRKLVKITGMNICNPRVVKVKDYINVKKR